MNTLQKIIFRPLLTLLLKGTELVHHICFPTRVIKSLIHHTRSCSLVAVHQKNRLMHGWSFFPTHTPGTQRKAFCYCLHFVWFLGVSVSEVHHREAAVLMVLLTSRLICSSSPGAHKITLVFPFRQFGHTECFVFWPRCFCLAEIRVLVLLASLRPACSLRCICSSTHAFVTVRTKPQQHQRQQRPASKPAAHQHYKSLQSPLFLFVFLTLVQLCYFAFYLFIFLSFFFCTTGFSNLHKIPPS